MKGTGACWLLPSRLAKTNKVDPHCPAFSFLLGVCFLLAVCVLLGVVLVLVLVLVLVPVLVLVLHATSLCLCLCACHQSRKICRHAHQAQPPVDDTNLLYSGLLP